MYVRIKRAKGKDVVIFPLKTKNKVMSLKGKIFSEYSLKNKTTTKMTFFVKYTWLQNRLYQLKEKNFPFT